MSASASTPSDAPSRNTRSQALDQRKQLLRAIYPLQPYIPCRWTAGDARAIEESAADMAAEYESVLQQTAEHPESTCALTVLALASVGGDRHAHRDYLSANDLPHLRCIDDMCAACESEMARETGKRD